MEPPFDSSACRRCGHPIAPDAYRFGSREAGWEHMSGECVEPPFNPFGDADTPTELLGLLAGAASVCWSNPGLAGVFDSTRAAALVDAAVEQLIVLGWADEH